MTKYVIRDREAGNEIDWFTTLSKAEEVLLKYENEDRLNGTYTDNFYEIVEQR